VVDLTEGCEDMGVVDMSDLLINFNYTAAIMEQMKCIVTVDTAVAHIAGAMNLPCYVLLPYLPDWRWGVAGDATKWYDSVKLVRQAKAGDYDSRLRNIGYEVKHLIG
jgi:ADP-heptose:LPS heptosyltransferase